MRVKGVADGPRDAAMMPALLSNMAGKTVEVDFKPWKDIRVGGYPRKVKWALRVALADSFHAVVLWADADAEGPERLRTLRDAVRADPTSTVVPTVVGVPDPHAEAWLLDDPVAVRAVLQLQPEHPVPRAGPGSKALLNKLSEQSQRGLNGIPLMAALAETVKAERMLQPDATGFSAFEKSFQAATRRQT
jgi:hypothetical protein